MKHHQSDIFPAGASAFREFGCIAYRGSAEMVLAGRVAAGAAAAGKVNESTCDVGGGSAREADVSPSAAATGHGGDGRARRQPSPGARSRADSARPPDGAAVTCQRRARANAARTNHKSLVSEFSDGRCPTFGCVHFRLRCERRRVRTGRRQCETIEWRAERAGPCERESVRASSPRGVFLQPPRPTCRWPAAFSHSPCRRRRLLCDSSVSSDTLQTLRRSEKWVVHWVRRRGRPWPAANKSRRICSRTASRQPKTLNCSCSVSADVDRRRPFALAALHGLFLLVKTSSLLQPPLAPRGCMYYIRTICPNWILV